MSVKQDVQDLLEELDADYPAFYIIDNFLYDSEDRQLEGVIKIVMPDSLTKPYIRIYLMKLGKWFVSEQVDAKNLTDPEERAKIAAILERIRSALHDD